MRSRRYVTLVVWVATLALLVSAGTSFIVTQQTHAKITQDSKRFTLSRYPLLTKYAVDLTELISRNKLDRTASHEAQVGRLIAKLSDNEKAPVLLGAFSLDRNAIASELAFKLLSDTANGKLANKHEIGRASCRERV